MSRIYSYSWVYPPSEGYDLTFLDPLRGYQLYSDRAQATDAEVERILENDDGPSCSRRQFTSDLARSVVFT